MKHKKEFWVTNFSKLNVSLADLNITIPSYTSVNLMNKHYSFTEEQLEESLIKGSLYKKRDKIIKRETSPDVNKKNIKISKDSIPSRTKSVYEIKREFYEELEVSDEQYAEANAEFADIDSQPIKFEN